MSNDPIAIYTRTEFFWLSKYDGDRDPRPTLTGDDVRDRLASLQADLTDPKCTELIAGGDGRQTCIWRKVDGSY